MSLSVHNLTKQYGSQIAVNQINFTIEQGSIVGFLGPNGAGKSSTMKMLCGYIEPSKGHILVNDQKMTPNAVNLKKKIGYLSEQNPLYADMYVKEFLSFIGEIYAIPKAILPRRIEETIEMVGLGPEKNKKIEQLSKGYKQRVGLAQALIHDPEILILDEPTTGLDPNQLIEIRSLIKSLAKHKTVILSTHIMQEVSAMCDQVIIISKGKIIANENISYFSKKYKSLEEAFITLTKS